MTDVLRHPIRKKENGGENGAENGIGKINRRQPPPACGVRTVRPFAHRVEFHYSGAVA